MLDALRRIDALLKRRTELGRSAKHANLRRIGVEAVPGDDGLEVNITYEMEGIGAVNAREPLVFDLAPCPFALSGVRCTSADEVYEVDGLLCLRPHDRASWNGALVEFSLRLGQQGDRGEPSVLVVPDLLPAQAIEAVGADSAYVKLPRLDIMLDELAYDPLEDTTVLGGREAGDNWSPVVATIMQTGDQPSDFLNVRTVGLMPRFSGQLAAAAGEGWCNEVATTLADIAEYYALVNGHHVLADIVFVLDEELGVAGVRDLPGIVHFTKDEAVHRTAQSYELVAEFTRQLGRLWWGGHCRVTGPLGPALEAGIVAGQTLHYLTDRADAGLAAGAVRAFRAQAQGGIVQSRWAALQGLMPPRFVARVALRVFGFLQGSRENVQRFSAAASPFWGLYVDRSAVLERLRAVGIEIPSAI